MSKFNALARHGFYEGQKVFRIHKSKNVITINRAIVIKVKYNSIIASILASPVEDMSWSGNFDQHGFSRWAGRLVVDVNKYFDKWKDE